MLKKLILVSGMAISFLSYAGAEISSTPFENKIDVQQVNYETKIFKFEIGQIKKDFIEKSHYGDSDWYLISRESGLSYYIQKNPNTHKISRLKITYPFIDSVMGQDLKNLSNDFGEGHYVNDQVTFKKDNITIMVSVVNDPLDSSSHLAKSTIDIIDYTLNQERLDTEYEIYNFERMNRTSNKKETKKEVITKNKVYKIDDSKRMIRK